MESNIFEKATKLKLRFSYKGQVSTEDLWDLKVGDLDSIYRQLNHELKEANEVTLLKKPTLANELLTLKVELVKRIVEVKLAEDLERKTKAEKQQQKKRILDVLAEKQDEGLKGKSEEELQKLLQTLE